MEFQIFQSELFVIFQLRVDSFAQTGLHVTQNGSITWIRAFV